MLTISLCVDVLLLCACVVIICVVSFFCFQAEDGILDLVRSRGLGYVYKRQRSSHSFRQTGDQIPALPRSDPESAL